MYFIENSFMFFIVKNVSIVIPISFLLELYMMGIEFHCTLLDRFVGNSFKVCPNNGAI